MKTYGRILVQMAKRKARSSSATSTFTVGPPRPATPKQGEYLQHLKNNTPLIITIGPAGTGKTYVAAHYAAYLYKTSVVDKIVLSRPTVPTGKSIGFFPGSLEEKMAPWVAPFIQVFQEVLGKEAVEIMIKKNQIEIVPFEVIRGRTFKDAFVILDEAQNCTKLELKAFVTRLGENSITVINGDITQSDLNGSGNGLDFIVSIMKNYPPLKEFCALIEFNTDDIVRSELCKWWVKAFERFDTLS